MPLILTQTDLAPLFNDDAAMDEAFEAIEAGFLEHEAGTAPRLPAEDLPLTGPQRSIRLNKGASPTFGVSLRTYPNQLRTNANSHVNLLFDPSNGQLQAIIAGDELNMLRTAIPAGVAARRLARPGARVLAMVGSGRQARGQVRTITHALPDLERIVVYSPTEEHRRQYAEEMAPLIGLPIDPVGSCQEAMAEADVVALVASPRQPVFEADWLQAGALAISINSGQIPPDLLSRARVVLGYRPEPAGQPYQAAIEQGWSLDKAVAYGELVGGQPGRTADDQIILADLFGLGVWDVSLLAWAYRWALAHEVGTEFHLSS